MEKNMEEYIDGWEGLTRRKWEEMNKYPGQVWITVFGGAHIFQAESTLKANGLHPDKIPEVFKDDRWTLGKMLKKVEETIPLTFVPTLDL
jgi:hypothetical protein